VDARNIPGTRCYHIEKHIKKNASHKQIIIVINKCDLVPSWVTRKWIKLLSKEFPTLAFHASISHSFGKGALITLLRQFAKLHNVRYVIVTAFVVSSDLPSPSFSFVRSASASPFIG
jgi:nuclear GTP-binding protein